jgi:hypothetical protein
VCIISVTGFNPSCRTRVCNQASTFSAALPFTLGRLRAAVLMERLAALSSASCSSHGPVSFNARRRFPQQAGRQQQQRRPRLFVPRSSSGGHPEERDGPQGDSGLQESLVKQLEFEIGKKRVRLVQRWPLWLPSIPTSANPLSSPCMAHFMEAFAVVRF